jgi:hypothetical protein
LQKEVYKAISKLAGKTHLAGARHVIWDKKKKFILQAWKHFIKIRYEEALAVQVQQRINQLWVELGEKPQVADSAIKF